MARAMPASVSQRDEDTVLFQAVQRGDAAAFQRLMARHGRSVRGIVLAVLGSPKRLDDVAQQAWSLVWQRAGSLREPPRWKAWVARLARNAALDAGREETRRRLFVQPGDEVLDGWPAGSPSPDDVVARAEAYQLVLAAIAGLPPHYREPFVLRHLQDWSYRQIGEHLDLPVNTVEIRLVRARRLLREALQDKV